MNQDFSMHANPLVAKLQKPASELTKADIISYIKENGITMVNFMYPAADGRLKTLNFVIMKPTTSTPSSPPESVWTAPASSPS